MVRASWRQSKTAPRAFFFWSMGFGCDKLITARRPEKKVDCRMKAAKHPARKRIAFLLKARAVAQKATESGRERRVLVQRLASDKARALDWCAPPALPHKCSQNSLGHFTFCSVTGKVVVVVSGRLRLRSATFRAAKSRRDRAPHQPCTQDTDKTTPTAQPSLPGFTAGVGPKSHLVPGFERDTDAARLDMHTQTQAQVTHTFCRRGDRLQALQCWRSCPQGMRQ